MNTMKSFKFLAAAGITATVIGSVAFAAPALAWHPVGHITKFIANETTNSASIDANTAKDGVSATTGNILRYTITIKNDGQPDSSGKNDLAFVELTDTLPAGVELVSNPAQRTIKETIPGTIAPGKSITKEYKVKVTSATNGDAIKNTACFEGNSTVKDNKQEGCDVAYATVKVETPTPTPTPTPVQPKALPSTGPEAAIGSLTGLTALGYASVSYARSKKALRR